MSNLDRLTKVRAGLHASVNDFSTAPSTWVWLEPESHGFKSEQRKRIARDPMRGDARNTTSIVAGYDVTQPIPMQMLLRGMSGNTGGAVTSATAATISNLLTSVFGGAATDPASTATTATAGTGTAGSLTLTSGTNFPNNSIVWFRNTDNKYFARRIVSGGGTTSISLDLNYEGTALTTSNTVVRAPYWALSSSTANHTHMGFEVEGVDWRRTYFGCLSSAVFDFTEGEIAKVDFSWQCTEIAENTPSLTFSAGSDGNFIQCTGAQVWFGNSPFFAKSVKVDLGNTIVPRTCLNGDNGVAGYVVTRKEPKITLRLYRGSNTYELSASTGTVNMRSLQELAAANGAAMTGVSVGIQIGSTYQSGCYWSIPAANIDSAVHVVENGQEFIDVTMTASRSSAGADLYFGLA